MASAARSRQTVILDLLARDGFVDIAGLQRELRCSEATIRRDLERLALALAHFGGSVDDFVNHIERQLAVHEAARPAPPEPPPVVRSALPSRRAR